MKFFWGFSLTLLLALPLAGRAAQTAQTTLFSRSLRFYQSIDENDLFSLNMSSLPNQNNGELGPYFYFFGPTTHAAYLDLVDQLFFDHYYGGMDLNVPAGETPTETALMTFFKSRRESTPRVRALIPLPGWAAVP